MHRTRYLLVVLSVLALQVLLPALPAGAQEAGGIEIVDFDFAPKTSTIKAGTKVTFTNTGDRPHTATDRGGTFDTQPIAPNGKATVTFSAPGTYFIFCRINPSKMNGTVKVEPGDEPAKVSRVQAVDPGNTGEVNFRFDPAQLEVAAGSTVQVANVGGKPHTFTADDGSFDTEVIAPGAEGGRFAGKNASITVREPGRFPFHCDVHPKMKGVLTVTGEATEEGPAAASAGARKGEVKMADFSFDPAQLSVAPEAEVTFPNGGAVPHTATFDDIKLDTNVVQPGASGTVTAPAEPGSYSYKCNIHPAKMRGVIVVLGPGQDDPAPAPVAAVAPAVGGGGGGGGGPGGGVTTLALVAAIVASLLGGFGLAAFMLRRRAPAEES